MAYRIEVARQAELDLHSIFEFIQASSSEVAIRWFRGLVVAIESLENLPHRGSPKQDGRREILYGRKPHRYRIVYRVNDARRLVQVLYVRHGAQKIRP